MREPRGRRGLGGGAAPATAGQTDRIDGEGLLRALLAFKRGEPRVCSMVRPPTPEADDERRMCRERAELIEERIGTSTGSRDCCSRRGGETMNRCAASAASGSSSCARAMAGRSGRI